MTIWRSALLAVALVAMVTFAGIGVVYGASDTKARVRHMTGTVVSVSEEAKTVTVKPSRQKGHEQTFAVDKVGAAALTNLKPGEQVRISYTESAGHMTAESISRGDSRGKEVAGS
jgi:ribosomal protein S17